MLQPASNVITNASHAGHFRSIFSHLCGLLLSADHPQKIFSRLWNVKISILYKKSAGKIEPMYWEKTKLKWPAWVIVNNIINGFVYEFLLLTLNIFSQESCPKRNCQKMNCWQCNIMGTSTSWNNSLWGPLHGGYLDEWMLFY